MDAEQGTGDFQISTSEKIQSVLAQGEELTADEQELVRMCASDLLSTVPIHQPQKPYYDGESDGKQDRLYIPGQSADI